MKGLIFTEFMEMMDHRFGPELTERVLDAAQLPSGGVYTTVGTYAPTELLTLVAQLSRETGESTTDLIRAFSHYLFGRIVTRYPRFFEGVHSAFDFLEQVNNHLHIEVLKLHPTADLPRFSSSRKGDDVMVFDYHSNSPMADLVEGLITGCVSHYGKPVDIQRTRLHDQDNGTITRFLLTRQL